MKDKNGKELKPGDIVKALKGNDETELEIGSLWKIVEQTVLYSINNEEQMTGLRIIELTGHRCFYIDEKDFDEWEVVDENVNVIVDNKIDLNKEDERKDFHLKALETVLLDEAESFCNSDGSIDNEKFAEVLYLAGCRKVEKDEVIIKAADFVSFFEKEVETINEVRKNLTMQAVKEVIKELKNSMANGNIDLQALSEKYGVENEEKTT